jgi:hypothetical protein
MAMNDCPRSDDNHVEIVLRLVSMSFPLSPAEGTNIESGKKLLFFLFFLCRTTGDRGCDAFMRGPCVSVDHFNSEIKRSESPCSEVR